MMSPVSLPCYYPPPLYSVSRTWSFKIGRKMCAPPDGSWVHSSMNQLSQDYCQFSVAHPVSDKPCSLEIDFSTLLPGALALTTGSLSSGRDEWKTLHGECYMSYKLVETNIHWTSTKHLGNSYRITREWECLGTLLPRNKQHLRAF